MSFALNHIHHHHHNHFLKIEKYTSKFGLSSRRGADNIPGLKLFVAISSSAMVKFLQEGLKEQDVPSSSVAEEEEPAMGVSASLLILLDRFPKPMGGKLESRLMDLCFHSLKNPRHSALSRIIWATA